MPPDSPDIERIVTLALANHRQAVAEDLRSALAPFARANSAIARALALFDGAQSVRDQHLATELARLTAAIGAEMEETAEGAPTVPVSPIVQAARDRLHEKGLDKAGAVLDFPGKLWTAIRENPKASLSIAVNILVTIGLLTSGAPVVSTLVKFLTGGAP